MLSKITKNDLKNVSAGWHWDEHGTLWLSRVDLVALKLSKKELLDYCIGFELSGIYLSKSILVSFFLNEKLKIAPYKDCSTNSFTFVDLKNL